MPQEADMSLTEMAFNGNNARYIRDSQLYVKFYMGVKKDKKASLEAGRPIFKDVPFVQIMAPGNKDSIIDRPADDMDKARFAEQYKRFMANQEQTPEGTPLTEWPELTRSQIEEFKYMGVHTVEQLAGMSDGNAQGMMGLQALKQKAQAYLDGFNEKDAKIAELEARLAQMEQEMTPRRGRPKKEEAETAE